MAYGFRHVPGDRRHAPESSAQAFGTYPQAETFFGTVPTPTGFLPFKMRPRTYDGLRLTPGVNVDKVDIGAGLAKARDLGYGDDLAAMVVQYALQRHARGEEDGAERTWLNEYPRDLTSWRVILAAAVAAAI